MAAKSFLHHFLIGLVLIFALGPGFGQTSFAKSDTDHLPATVQTKDYSAFEIESMDTAQLEQLVQVLLPHWHLIHQAMRGDEKQEVDIDSLRFLSHFQLESSAHIFIGRIRKELGRKESGGISYPVITTCLEGLEEVATARDEESWERLQKLDRELVGDLNGGSPEESNVLRLLAKVLESAEQAQHHLAPSLDKLLESKFMSPEFAKKSLQTFETTLNSRIIGQPELVEALTMLEWKSELQRGHRTHPDVIYVIGQPGTGKDTGAEAFTDALYEQEGAYKEHMFRLPLMRTQADLWQVLGSATGFVGSDSLPPFIRFLVQHSDGKYILQSVSGRETGPFRVIENPEYHGKTLPGYFPPDKAVVFANEFHNWAKDIKDIFLKQALEKGIFTINNPNGGLSEISVPVHFFIASNEGIGLIGARETNGRRSGRPLNYDQMLAKWSEVHLNKEALKSEIMATNGPTNQADARGTTGPGISEELLNRIPDRYLLILRPQAPEALKDIAAANLKKLAQTMSSPSRFFKSIDLSWDESVPEFIQSYHYQPEENARPIASRISNLIEETFIKAVQAGEIPSTGQNIRVALSIAENEDGTRDLVMNVDEEDGSAYTVRKLIGQTLRDRPADPISNDRIDQLSDLAARLKKRVFGIDGIADRLAQRVLSIENELTAGKVRGQARPASTIVVMGLSSTGKTELAKALAKEVEGNEEDLMTLDFSQIQTLADFQKRILGLRDGAGNPIPSEFMKLYDRNNGRVLVAFDELANVRDQDLLKALYDFFREPIVTTFSDGKPREMTAVKVIVTGNAGQEIYKNVPRNVPMEMQMMAFEEISKNLSKDLELQRQILERYFPEPLITRWGKNNIFFVPPHSYRSLRQLTQLKLGQMFERMANARGRRGWNVLFPNKDEYARFVTMVINEGFSLRYQGASIDTFVRDDVEEPLKSLLLANKVESGSTVVLSYHSETDNSDEDLPGWINYDVYVDGRAEPLTLSIKRPHVDQDKRATDNNKLLTAFHEAGHSIARQALLGDKYGPGKITIIPGVAQINQEWIVYLGLASSHPEEDVNPTREHYVREIAVLAAGETAERLVSKGEIHSAGKSNDMERATTIAQNAILRFGLSEKWGTSAIPVGMTPSQYLATLSEKQREVFESEVQAMVEEGRQMARRYLELNYKNALVPLGLKLAEQGELSREEMKSFYETTSLITPERPADKSLASRLGSAWHHWTSQWGASAKDRRDGTLRADIPRPEKMADINEIVQKRKQDQFASVPLPEKINIGTNDAYLAQSSCESILE